MLFLDGVYAQDSSGHYFFRRTSPPTVAQLHHLLQQISERVARFLERRGMLERDEDNSYLPWTVSKKIRSKTFTATR